MELNAYKKKSKLEKIISHIKNENQELKESNNMLEKYEDNSHNDDINNIKKEIEEYKTKINNFSTLNLKEKYVSVIFKEDNKIKTSIFCRNTDKFVIAFNKFQRKYGEYEGFNYNFVCDNKIIDLEKTLDENNINNGAIIHLIRKE